MALLSRLLWVGAVATAVLIDPAVMAQPGKGKGEEKREEKKEKREERREDRQDKREDRREDRQEGREERREKRQERRKDRRKELKDKWGDLVKRPEVRNELGKHARRMARLNRLLVVADEANKPDAKKKIEELIAKEKARHEKRMAKWNEKKAGDK